MNSRETRKQAGDARGAGPASRTLDIRRRLDSALRHHRAGRLHKAKPLYHKVLKLDPNNNDAMHMLGLLAHQSGDVESAIKLLGRAVDVNRCSAELFTNFGNALQSVGRLDEAVAAFRAAIQVNPGFTLAHNNLGNALLGLGQHEVAMDCFREAIRLSPDYAAAHYNLGNALHAVGDETRAMVCFRQTLAIDPDHSSAACNLASVLADSGETEQAAELFRRVLRRDRNNTLAQHMLAALTGRTTAAAPAGYVVRLFDGIADQFDRKLVVELGYRAPQFLRQAVGRLIGDPQARFDVMDIGCGTGLCGPLFGDLAKTLYGVDVSPNMLAQAERRGVYDRLLVADISKQLPSAGQTWDLVLAADVFIYVGDLQCLFENVAKVLRPGGLFAFSLEKHRDSGFVLRPSGRYAHSMSYIRELTGRVGLTELSVEEQVLRQDKRAPVNGYICVLGKAGS